MEDLSIEAKEVTAYFEIISSCTMYVYALGKNIEDMSMVSMMEGPRRTEKPTGVIFRKVCFYFWIKTHLASRVVVHRVLKADMKLWLAAVMHGEVQRNCTQQALDIQGPRACLL
ncbi:hypothetical protein Zm00014a_017622 [Zea mays]|uniref:Uncharacterized protein n=1 Tax=Zea mays TaxID=4577 RepID=A0A3L6ESR3_MAIZE|nr:hypothetical protein Zm00014a_017622 [Zea mays]